MKRTTSNSAFTLIELSIVLVIISLVVGGILVGRDLIRAAEFRKIHTQQEKFITAANAFRDKYHCMPGDCSNATEFFGEYDGATDPCNTQTFPYDRPRGTATCNGNGDGKLDIALVVETTETILAWQHLAAAGLIEGIYSGSYCGGTHCPDGNTGWYEDYNCPKIESGHCWQWVDNDNSAVLAMLTFPFIAFTPGGADFMINATGGSDKVGTVLAMWPTNNDWASISYPMGIFNPAEAFGYDSKFDDGNPVTGNLLINLFSIGGECLLYLGGDTLDPTQYTYDTSTSPDAKSCTFAYLTGLYK